MNILKIIAIATYCMIALVFWAIFTYKLEETRRGGSMIESVLTGLCLAVSWPFSVIGLYAYSKEHEDLQDDDK